MDLYIDTEFNGFGGQLISMAIVDTDYEYFYEVIGGEWIYHPDDWVKKNVFPFINLRDNSTKIMLNKKTFQQKLQEFLTQNKYANGFNLIGDWPDDIRHFCDMLITGPGEMINIPSFSIEVVRELNSDSKVPHNAYYDAVANMELDQKFKGR